ncbi:MAG: CPBP family intramembrane metalloprotease [Planctomycetes bacterium]|nr:CPBP family intramembrane metalloprotease [Planctomycetota bacterium]
MQQYHQRTRSLSFSLLLVLPLLAFYEAWLLFFRPSVVNAAGVALKLPMEYLARIFQHFGSTNFLNATLLFNLVLIGIFFVAYYRTRKQGDVPFGLFVPLLLESALYGLLLGRVVLWIMQLPSLVSSGRLAMSQPATGTFDSIMLSVGAGVYEEIFFRLLLVGGLYVAGILIFDRGKANLALAMLLAAAVFLAALKQFAMSTGPLTWPGFAGGLIRDALLIAAAEALVLGLHAFLIWLLKNLGLKPPTAVGCASVFLGALLFSAFHHVGPLGYPLEARAFFFRFLAGLILSLIYQVRGLGVAVYTHAFYDILVVFSR